MRPLSLGRLLRSLAISVSVAILTALAVYFVSYPLFPVTGLDVTGARMFPESEAWRMLPDRASLLTLNTVVLENEIEDNPWVEGAKVIKNWDSGIVMVEVKERRAILSGVIEGREVVFAADGAELPGTGGARLARVGLDEGRLEEVLGIVRVLEGNGAGLESVDAAGVSGVEATVAGRRVLFAGDVGAKQVRALEGLMEQHPEASYFDLRSPGRVVVGAEPGG